MSLRRLVKFFCVVYLAAGIGAALVVMRDREIIQWHWSLVFFADLVICAGSAAVANYVFLINVD